MVLEFSVGQAVFKLWIKTVKMLFGSITQELLGLPVLPKNVIFTLFRKC